MNTHFNKTTDNKPHTQKDKVMEKDKKPPIETLKDGSISIKLWEQNKGEQTYLTASLGKSYKDADGQWRESHSFGKDDLLKLQALIPKAREVMQNHLEQSRTTHKQQNDMAAERENVMTQSSQGGTQKDMAQDHAPPYQPER